MSKFQACADAKERYQLVMQYARALPEYPEELKQNANRVLGCTAQVSRVTPRLSSFAAIIPEASLPSNRPRGCLWLNGKRRSPRHLHPLLCAMLHRCGWMPTSSLMDW